ncbi:MAG TPA: peptidase M75 family protein, partial [Marmoricola sp.]|nr:peptidase M75 family protein [Marmoricola sp.]
SQTEHESGRIAFKIKNTGDKVTEFYFYAEDGQQIMAEIENIGPGLSRDLVLQANPGTYVTACKPGMVGKGIRGDFKVTGEKKDLGVKGVDAATIKQATDSYAAYVKDQTSELIEQARAFTQAYVAGNDDEARRLYPIARAPWERTETVAESFGDLDPKTDAREADLEPGQKWTGWHLIEKDLWPPAKGYTPLTPAQRKAAAEDLMANLTTLHERVQTLTYTVDQIGNGSKGLLDEVATGKITGEEDIWSHTDLYDFQANLDGARVAYQVLKPLLEIKDAALSEKIGEEFTNVQELLNNYRQGDGFVSYDQVTEAQRRVLSDAVNALAEPLSQMTGAITS